MKYIIVLILLLFTSSVFSQNFVFKNSKDRSDENLDNMPFTVGLEYGLFLPFKNSYYTSSIYGSLGYYLTEKKTVSIELVIGKVFPRKDLNISNFTSGGLGFSWRFMKVDKSRLLANLGFALMTNKEPLESEGGFDGGFNAGITYLYNIRHIVNISASLKYPFIGGGSGNGNKHHYPVFSLGLLLFPR